MPRLVPLVILIVVAGPLAAQPQGGFTPFTSRPLDREAIESNTGYKLYTDPVIQAELKLTDEQKAEIARIPDDLLAKHKDEIAKEQAALKAEADKQEAAAAELTKRADDLLAKHLSAAQRKRFDQLVVQLRGMRAFADPEVANALALTADQQAKRVEIQREGLEKFQKEFPLGGTATAEDREKRAEAGRKMVREMLKRFVETFTAEQKKKWAELAGEPCEAVAQVNRTTGPAVDRPGGVFAPGSPFALRATVLNTDKIRAELTLDGKTSEALTTEWKAIQQDALQASFTPAPRPDFSGPSYTVPAEAATTAAKRLTDPQTKRLTQIQLQLRGLGVFSSGSAAAPSVCGRLHITPAQAAKIEAVFTDTGKQVQALPRPVLGGGTREELEKATAERNRRAAEIARKGLAEVLATFDAGQKAAWRELTGEPFDVTKVGTGLTPTPFFSPVPNQGLIANALVSEATANTDRGEYAAALAALDEAIRLAPKNSSARTRKASLLATCPSEWARDGKQAVELMKAVMAETKEPGSGDYIVLAVAHAEARQFDDAVKAQEKAIELLAKRRPSPVGTSNAQLKEQYEARLKLYREKKPYRMDPPQTRAER